MIPFGDVAFKIGAVLPEHKESVVGKLGVMLLLTVTLSVTLVAHCPAFGVKT